MINISQYSVTLVGTDQDPDLQVAMQRPANGENTQSINSRGNRKERLWRPVRMTMTREPAVAPRATIKAIARSRRWEGLFVTHLI
jgi:hypothetical protein